MDLDLERCSPMDQDDFAPTLLSQPVVPILTDYVKWQGSQTSCAALDTLIMEASASARRSTIALFFAVVSPQLIVCYNSDPRPLKTHIPWYSPVASDTFPSTASSSSSNLQSASRASAKPHSRSRPSRHSEPTRNPLHSNLFNKPDPAQFLNLVKGVSERVDENAEMQARLADDGRQKRKTRLNPPVSGQIKDSGAIRKTRRGSGLSVTIVANKGRSAEPDDRGVDVERLRRAGSVNAHRSLPNIASSSSSSSMEGVITDANTSMMDIDPQGGSSSSSTPTLCPSPKECTPMPPPIISSQNHPSHYPSCSTATPFPVPKLHPLLQQQQQHKQEHPRPSPRPQLHAQPRPRPSQHPPTQRTAGEPPRIHLATASARPPALGMRRTHTLPALTPSQQLPTRQKGFKPPLLSQAPAAAAPVATACQQQQQHAPARSQAHPQAVPLPRAAKASAEFHASRTLPTPTPSPHARRVDAGDDDGNEGENGYRDEEAGELEPLPPHRSSSPDSSFGDMSFDMDALEETMRMYD